MCLHGLGRLTEAIQPNQFGIEAWIECKSWRNVVSAA